MKTDSKWVWYASYGSNLSEKRFMCYIAGGKPPGSQVVNPGSRDKTPPTDKRPVLFNWELYFAGYSTWWSGAGAFIRQSAQKAVTYGRMYLITDEQFNDVVIQENGGQVDGTGLVPPFETLVDKPDFILPGVAMYGRLVSLGKEAGCPILTFTSTKDDLEVGPPSESYLKIIVLGIRETYPSMKESEICEYLMNADGIRGRIPKDKLRRWVAEAD